MGRYGINRSLRALSAAMAAAAALCACHSGGTITSSPAAQVVAPVIAVPTIASPAASPFYSNSSTFSISGSCESGDTVVLSGAAAMETPCSQFSYQFLVNQQADGIYSYEVSQENAIGGVSPSAGVVWVRQTSVAPPGIASPSAKPFLSGLS